MLIKKTCRRLPSLGRSQAEHTRIRVKPKMFRSCRLQLREHSSTSTWKFKHSSKLKFVNY